MRAERIIRPSTAFSLSTGRKRPRDQSKDHLKTIRALPCVICGTHKEVEAAHIRMASLQFGKRETGAGEKSDDAWTLPLCAFHHRLGPASQHTIGEQNFWEKHKISPFVLALALWRATGDQTACELIIADMPIRLTQTDARGSE